VVSSKTTFYEKRALCRADRVAADVLAAGRLLVMRSR
jgi:hypothetical protein